MTQPMHVRYRPTAFDEVLGQGNVAHSMEAALRSGDSRAFLLSGPSGCGKTTLSRIGAHFIGCSPENVIEIDAATHTGVDDVRALQEVLSFIPFGENTNRAVIVDECHRLSANARDSLLKVIEEPPEGVYWFLCTTEPGKVPVTIKTRCNSYTLNSVKEDDLGELLDWVCEEEKIEMSEDVADMCVHEAHGSPRQLLVNIATCRDAETKKDAADLLKTALDSEPVRDLCQLLLNNGSWIKAMKIVEKMENESPESVRIVICRYMTKVLMGKKNHAEIRACLGILEAFRADGMWNQSEGTAPLVNAIGRIMYSE